MNARAGMDEEAIADRILEDVAGGGLLSAGRPVVVMLSGGRDSTCLLDLAVRISGAAVVAAIHVNYGLRAGADGDERHCRELSAALGVPIEVRSPSSPPEGNLHAWARAQRYDAASALAGETRDIAAGHTAGDQVETILYRLASSPSRRALLGMSPREGQLIRPLLGVGREQTAEYCRARGWRWREDESNDAPQFARARVRNRLIPALREIHPGAERNVLALASILREEAAALDALVDDALKGAGEISLQSLHALPRAVAALVLQRLADDAAGGPAAGVARRTDELLDLSAHGRAELHVGAGLRAICERGVLRFEPLAPVGPDDRRAPPPSVRPYS